MSTATRSRASVSKAYTTTQTGDAVVTPSAVTRIKVRKVVGSVGGTTAGTFILWFSEHASTPTTDTSYTAGTDKQIVFLRFEADAVPMLQPRMFDIDFPEDVWSQSTARGVPLRVTTSANLTVDFAVYYDVVP